MKWQTAIKKLRVLAEACEGTKRLPSEEPFLLEAHVFGEVVEGAEPVDWVEVAFVLNLPAEEVPWASEPHGTAWLVDVLRLDKGRFGYCWRPKEGPVGNHHIRGPVRFWSVDGTDEEVLRALAERRFDDLPRSVPDPGEVRQQAAEELRASLAHLREVRDGYWEREWRREHRGLGRYPENYLWEAVEGYLDLLDAAAGEPSAPAERSETR